MTEACKAVLVAGVPARFGQSVWDAVGTVTAGRRKGLFYDEQAVVTQEPGPGKLSLAAIEAKQMTDSHGGWKQYSDLRCEVTGKVVIANRDMGSTAVLRVAAVETQGMAVDEKRTWCAEHGKRLHDEVIQKYRASMPKSVRAENYAKVAVVYTKCGELLALYRKRNARKSQLVKMYVERIAEDTHSLLAIENFEIPCPTCERSFCRGPRMVKGRPAWKIISGRVRMK
eukprot:g12153.t1